MQIHAYRRTEPTVVELFGLRIDFKPNEHKHVVGETDDDRAIERLLSIDEAYRPYTGPGSAAEAPAPAPQKAAVQTIEASKPPPPDDNDAEEPLKAAEGLPPGFRIWGGEGEVTGIGMTLEQAVELAFKQSSLDREEWNLNDEEDREALILAAVDAERARVAAEKQAEAEAAAAQAGKGAGSAGQDTPKSYVLTNGTESVDLAPMSAAQLRAFAEQAGVKLPGGNSTKVGDLRDLLYTALTGK